jgi:hypothetical protein
VRADGSAITQPRYDPSTGLYLLSGAPTVVLPENLLRSDAEAAADVLVEAISTFPFIELADQAEAIAMFMGMLYARSLEAVPMMCVTATAPGAGKSPLVDVGVIVATNRRAAVVSIGRDPNEAGKRLSAGLLNGDLPRQLITSRHLSAMSCCARRSPSHGY